MNYCGLKTSEVCEVWKVSRSTLHHKMLSVVIVPYYWAQRLVWVPAFPCHCGLSQQRLEANAAEWRREAPLSLFFFFLWMLSPIMNECNSGKCAPRTVKETRKSSGAPEGICLWQTTSHCEENAAHWVPVLKRVKAWAHVPAPWRLWFTLDFNLKRRVSEKWCCM